MRLSQSLTTMVWATVLATTLSCGGGGGSGSSGNTPQSGSDACTPLGTSGVTVANAFPNLTFEQPVALLQHPQDPNRWYVVEQAGVVRTFSGAGATVAETFIYIGDRVASGGEAGLLGMAFHPDFAANHLFYLSYTGPGAPLVSHISAFSADSGDRTADPDSEQPLLSVAQPAGNHNGGWIAFGPDGLLYIGLGDGGGAGDPQGNAQNTQTLLGAILRIDVDDSDAVRGTAYAIPADNPFVASNDCFDPAGCPEIFAYGFRNPWRGSFDTGSGDLWIGDVGQSAWEEIDRVEAGLNYGWNIMEGDHCYNAGSCDRTGLTPPVAEYGHGDGISVTGGYVYRGNALSELAGDFIFGDFGSGQIWRIIDADQNGTRVAPLIASELGISSFAQDGAGELYVVGYGDGLIYQLAACTP
ncbi:MAG: PQQ-dependent sugar dehydrogenase [Desulfobacterales bacterium]|nr:PQQ-dependent sugar dehydrogenase [Desulfobacterales bacterium]